LIAKWHPKREGFYACACEEGIFILNDINTKEIKKVFADESLSEMITDLEWNPGEDILALTFLKGNIKLFSMSTNEIQMTFEKQSLGASSITWLDNISGDFLTSSVKVGALK